MGDEDELRERMTKMVGRERVTKMMGRESVTKMGGVAWEFKLKKADMLIN